jgi:hypothetical protein
MYVKERGTRCLARNQRIRFVSWRHFSLPSPTFHPCAVASHTNRTSTRWMLLTAAQATSRQRA